MSNWESDKPKDWWKEEEPSNKFEYWGDLLPRFEAAFLNNPNHFDPAEGQLVITALNIFAGRNGTAELCDRILLMNFLHQESPSLDDGAYGIEDLADAIASIATEYFC